MSSFGWRSEAYSCLLIFLMSEKPSLWVEIQGHPSSIACSIHYNQFQYTIEINIEPRRQCRSNPNSHAFSVQFCFFLKTIIKISRTLQTVKTCTGFVPFILARNQFLLFSQVLNMFEAGCCQSLQFLPSQQIQWLHFRFHPAIPLNDSLAASSPRGPSQNPPLNPCDLSGEYQAPPMFPLWVIALPTLALHFQAWAAQAHTQMAQMLLQLRLPLSTWFLLDEHWAPYIKGFQTRIPKPAPPATVPTGILIHLVI